jgi:hypothetical protein
MDIDQAQYILRYFGHFMTKQEQRAQRHLFGTQKLTHGRSDATAQREARNMSHPTRELLSDDEIILQMTSEGSEPFLLRTAQRIFEEHRSEILFQYCPRCGRLAKTPKARQCRFCYHDWH